MKQTWQTIRFSLFAAGSIMIASLLPSNAIFAGNNAIQTGHVCLNQADITGEPGSGAHLFHADETFMDCSCSYFEGYTENEGLCLFDGYCPPLRERIRDWKLDVHPNPVREDYFIHIEGKEVPSQLRVKVVGVNGVIVHEDEIIENGKVRISSQQLPEGTYIAQLFIDELLVKRQIFVKIR